jgi:hypothetical protein
MHVKGSTNIVNDALSRLAYSPKEMAGLLGDMVSKLLIGSIDKE